MNEAETRAEHIDPALKAAGWGVVEGSRIRREYSITPGRIEGLGRRGKALTADYVLIRGDQNSFGSACRGFRSSQVPVRAIVQGSL
jgi:type I site-specific restriction endonuclease